VPETKTSRQLLLVALLAATLGGCAAAGETVSNLSIADFNPLKGSDPLRSADYNYFYRRDQTNAGIVTAADLVGPDGRCAFEPAPMRAPAAPEAVAQSPAAEAATDPINPRSNQALYFTAGPETGRRTTAAPSALPPQVSGGPRGIALQMTECQVVQAAGYTDRVEISANERGQRSVTLTYMSGERPGIYRFVGGRLASMERVAEPPQPKKPQKATKTARKTAPRQ
jgi:hypothetical protein